MRGDGRKSSVRRGCTHYCSIWASSSTGNLKPHYFIRVFGEVSWLKAWFQKASCVCGGPDFREGHCAFSPEKDNKQVVLYPVSAKHLAAVIRFYGGHRQVALWCGMYRWLWVVLIMWTVSG